MKMKRSKKPSIGRLLTTTTDMGIYTRFNKNESTGFPLPSKPHFYFGKIIQSSKENLVVYALVIWKVTKVCISVEKPECDAAPYNISVRRNCHGGYPFNCTVGLNKIKRSGSLVTWSLNCASIRSMLICSCCTSPFCAISASVRVRSTIVSRPSCSERSSTVRCWRSSLSASPFGSAFCGGVSGGE